MSEKTFGELFRERYVIKPDCFGKINIEFDKCGHCSVTGQCFNESSKTDSVRTCQKCGGSGRVEDVCNHLEFTKECELCDGVGKIPTESDSKRMDKT